MKSLKHIINKYFDQTHVFMISATYLQIVSDIIASLNLMNLNNYLLVVHGHTCSRRDVIKFQ